MKDNTFNREEKLFRSLEKTVRHCVKNISFCLQNIQVRPNCFQLFLQAYWWQWLLRRVNVTVIFIYMMTSTVSNLEGYKLLVKEANIKTQVLFFVTLPASPSPIQIARLRNICSHDCDVVLDHQHTFFILEINSLMQNYKQGKNCLCLSGISNIPLSST